MFPRVYGDAVATSTAAVTEPAKPRAGRRTTIALKMLMAGTGILFIGFLVLHMYGNLMAFGGQQTYDRYAEHLRTFLTPMLPYRGFLYVMEVVLVLALVGHAYAAFKLWKRAQDARPQRYLVRKAVKSSLSSRTMRWGGVALLLFVVFHILEFTLRVVTPGGDNDSPFLRMHNAMNLWWVFLIYAAAMVALGMHLHHGVWSASQTLGWTSSALSRRVAKTLGWVIALVITIGFILPPFFMLIGVL